MGATRRDEFGSMIQRRGLDGLIGDLREPESTISRPRPLRTRVGLSFPPSPILNIEGND